MKTVTVCTSRKYNVHIGRDVLENAADLICNVKSPCKAAVISDSNVFPLYAESLMKQLDSKGFEASCFTFPAGEASKNQNTYFHILSFLAQNKLTRSDLVIALGGGVVGDVTGFAAATYLRGIDYIQIPTSLLAMVDSSVGGKTAIDLPLGKNLAGAFYQPILVLCDVTCLNTLPVETFRDGCAEVIKYGILYDRTLFSHLYRYGLDFNREDVITRCIELKRDVVTADEYDTGGRQKLNLGHTVGHGIEAASDFTISHGQAVSIGTAIVTAAATKRGICSNEACHAVLSVFNKFMLPVTTVFSPETLYIHALSDKKRTGSNINLIIPREIGDCLIVPTSVDEMLFFIEAGIL